MAKVLEVFQWILANYSVLIAALNAVMLSLVALFLVIPGEQPEKFFQGIADFLSKFSKK